jgi:carboxylate-amine ligase
LDLQLGALGVHPWADYREQRIIDKPYYLRLVERLQFIAHRNNTFGLHVHVGIHHPDRAIAVCDRLREWVPELLALSASSPFFEGRDTGMASMRAVIFGRLFPRAGLPPVHGSWHNYQQMVRKFRNVGSVESYGQMWWHVRPHAIHGTIELRMFDAQPEIADTLALVALTTGLVAHLCDEIDDGAPFHPTPHHLLDENLWRAIRGGLQGELIDFDPELTEPKVRPMTERVAELIGLARTANAAGDLGLDEGLDRVEAMVREGGRAAQLRAQYLESGDLTKVYRSSVERTMLAPIRASQ